MGMGSYAVETLDHLGLVAAMCDDLGIVETIDRLIPQDFERRKVRSPWARRSRP